MENKGDEKETCSVQRRRCEGWGRPSRGRRPSSRRLCRCLQESIPETFPPLCLPPWPMFPTAPPPPPPISSRRITPSVSRFSTARALNGRFSPPSRAPFALFLILYVDVVAVLKRMTWLPGTHMNVIRIGCFRPEWTDRIPSPVEGSKYKSTRAEPSRN